VRPERILGYDPAPGDPETVDAVVRVLGSTVLALTEARARLERLVAPDGLWHGPRAEPVVRTIAGLSGRLRRLEDGVIDLAAALQAWGAGLAQRRTVVAGLTEAMSRLAGEPDADGQRRSLQAQAAIVAAEHAADAVTLVAAADEFAELLALHRDDPDLATDLDRALNGLEVAVAQWLEDAAPTFRAATRTVSDAAALTLAVPQLVGIGDQPPGEDPGVTRVAQSATGSHRLQRALRRIWDASVPRLPRATFEPQADPGEGVADRLRGHSPREQGS